MTIALANPLANLPVDTLKHVLVLVTPLVLVQLIQFNTGRLEFMRVRLFTPTAAAVAYSLMFYGIVFLGAAPQAFVYFQF
jgi:hypothetical protein